MNVFLSWSGEPSHNVALVLKDWLPTVVQAIDAWVSSKDIEKGASWFTQITDNLVKSEGVGVFCLTPGNLGSPWMAYEAGAIASQDHGRVMTFLHKVTATDVKPPLGLFQATNSSTEDDVFLLLKTLNARCKTPLQPERLKRAFDLNWPTLRQQLEDIPDAATPKTQQMEHETPALLNEILSVVRRIEKDRRIPSDRTIDSLAVGTRAGIINSARYSLAEGIAPENASNWEGEDFAQDRAALIASFKENGALSQAYDEAKRMQKINLKQR